MKKVISKEEAKKAIIKALLLGGEMEKDELITSAYNISKERKVRK